MPWTGNGSKERCAQATLFCKRVRITLTGVLVCQLGLGAFKRRGMQGGVERRVGGAEQGVLEHKEVQGDAGRCGEAGEKGAMQLAQRVSC